MSDVLIAGAGSTLALALAEHFQKAGHRVIGVGRTGTGAGPYDLTFSSDYSETSLAEVALRCRRAGVRPNLILCCVGVLHDDLVIPEKRLADIQSQHLAHYFAVNSILPVLILKHLVPLLNREAAVKVAFLSAKVGSIGDNRLGGWYGYRASKAALNMLIRTAAIELARRHREVCVVALHPGTTHSPLSEPFTDRIPKGRIYAPQQSAERLARVIEGLTPEDNGQFFHWDGTRLPW